MRIVIQPYDTELLVQEWAAKTPEQALANLKKQLAAAKVLWPVSLKGCSLRGQVSKK